MNVTDLPTVNAVLNLISAVLLALGFREIHRQQRERHKKFMMAAVISSALFLTSYLIYHYAVGSVPYPYKDWSQYLYYAILIPHVILAAVMTPFILLLLWRAFKGRFDLHRKLARWVWPVWMFVSVSGVVIYLMLYIF